MLASAKKCIYANARANRSDSSEEGLVVSTRPVVVLKPPSSKSRSTNPPTGTLKELSGALQVRELEDWYRVTTKMVETAGRKTLRQHGYSLYKSLVAEFPHHEFIPWKFNETQRGYWDSLDNQRKYVEWVGKQLQLSHLSDWYKVKQADFVRFGGGGLIKGRYAGSPSKLLLSVFPDHPWELNKFNAPPSKFWDNQAHQADAFAQLTAKLGVETLDDWYKITTADIQNAGAGALLRKFGKSSTQMLKHFHPTHTWHEWRFGRVSSGFWYSEEGKVALRKLLEQIRIDRGFLSLEDWYRVSSIQSREMHLSHIIEQYGGLVSMLRVIYPEHSWSDSPASLLSKRSSQNTLIQILKVIFGHHAVIEEYPLSEKHDSTSARLTLDAYVPSLKLGVEYQGQGHFDDIYKPSENVSGRERDIEKAARCSKQGITLVEIPHWIELTTESVKTELLRARADLNIAQN